jgi:hypothetical protein
VRAVRVTWSWGESCVCVKVQDLGFVRVAVSGDFVCE